MTELSDKKWRADIRECLNSLHERIKIIEKKFNIKLDEQDKILFGDLKRDIVLGDLK